MKNNSSAIIKMPLFPSHTTLFINIILLKIAVEKIISETNILIILLK